MKYYVTIEESISQRFEVDAISAEEAMEIAEKKYNKGEFVLEHGNLVAKQMMAENELQTDITEWTEF